jgi:mRNA interferase RelE/StbE
MALETDPRPPGCVKLAGREGWRVRVGDYRVLYSIDDNARVISVKQIGHRRDVYR